MESTRRLPAAQGGGGGCRGRVVMTAVKRGGLEVYFGKKVSELLVD